MLYALCYFLIESMSKDIAKKSRRPKKRKVVQLLEYGAVSVLLPVVHLIPLNVIHLLGNFLGDFLYFLFPGRRRLALENVRHALDKEKTEGELRAIARASCRSFFLTCLEIIKFHNFFKADDAREALSKYSGSLESLFQKAKRLHEESGGCIFVTPHIGNWEFLPHVSSIVGIPLVVVARPLSNAYLERFLYGKRTDSGQVIIPKKNALFMLQKTLQQGKSIGLLPDQSIRQGIAVNFFGRRAWTTPAPAILSVLYKRPIVVVACCRTKNGYDFEGVVSDPLWPGTFESEKAEIFRLTEEMNKQMEIIVKRYPEQYFWVHNRWKRHSKSRELNQ